MARPWRPVWRHSPSRSKTPVSARRSTNGSFRFCVLMGRRAARRDTERHGTADQITTTRGGNPDPRWDTRFAPTSAAPPDLVQRAGHVQRLLRQIVELAFQDGLATGNGLRTGDEA